MSDEAEQTDEEYAPTTDDSEKFASAMYQSHTAELTQAFGNLLAQALPMPVGHPFMSITLVMLEKVAGSVETKPKGALKSLTKD
jgi:hypothetical protein